MNIINLERVRLSNETMETILKHYSAFYKEEKKNRMLMEKTLNE